MPQKGGKNKVGLFLDASPAPVDRYPAGPFAAGSGRQNLEELFSSDPVRCGEPNWAA